MKNSQKNRVLTKRALKAKKTKNCSSNEALDYAHKYAEYLESVKVNAKCMGFDKWIKTK